MYILPLILAALLSGVHFFTDFFSKELHKSEKALTSFVAGLTVVYVFLELLPRLFIKVQFTNRIIFVWIVFGFLMLHLAEKYIFHHVQNRERIKLVKESHSLLIFIFYIFIGILLTVFANEGYRVLGLFWFILAFNLLVNNISMHNIYVLLSAQTWFKLIISAATIIGAIIGLGFVVPDVWIFAFTALFAGMLLYTVVRTLTCEDDICDMKWFVIGQLVFVLIVLAIWIA